MSIMMFSRPRLARVLPLLGSALLLSACGQDMSDLEPYIAEVKARKSRAIEPIPQVKQYEAFTYEARGRRDPFIKLEPERSDSNQVAAVGNGIRPDFNRNREPLEEFPLDSLRMVGTIVLQGTTYSLIKAPDSVIHRVVIGDHMGQNYGRIIGINETEVALVEIIPDGFGGWMERPAALALTEN